MGQKVNPVGMRIGINKEWNSRWFANKKDFVTYLHEDIKIRKALDNSLDKKGEVSHIEITRKIAKDGKINLYVYIYAKFPATLVGEENKGLNAASKLVEKNVNKNTKVFVKMVRVEHPDLDATIVAKKIATDLENRVSFRVAQKTAIKATLAAGAKGIKTEVSGRLAGADIARSEGYKKGTIPLHTLRSDVDYACAEAATIYGRLGIKVWICRGEILPDAKNDDDKGE